MYILLHARDMTQGHASAGCAPADVLAKKLADTSTSPYCKFDDQKLQTFTSCLFLAGLVASFPAAWVTQHKGRKVSMIISGAMYMIGAPPPAARVLCLLP